MTVKDSSAGSGDLSKANRELHRRVSELEWQVSKQKACIREQRRQQRQQQKSRGSQESPQTVEVITPPCAVRMYMFEQKHRNTGVCFIIVLSLIHNKEREEEVGTMCEARTGRIEEFFQAIPSLET